MNGAEWHHCRQVAGGIESDDAQSRDHGLRQPFCKSPGDCSSAAGGALLSQLKLAGRLVERGKIGQAEAEALHEFPYTQNTGVQSSHEAPQHVPEPHQCAKNAA